MVLRATAAFLVVAGLAAPSTARAPLATATGPQVVASDMQLAWEHADAASSAVQAGDWERAFARGTQAMERARAAIATARDRCEQLGAGEYLMFGAWSAARGEHGRQRSQAALDLLEEACKAPELAPEHRGQLLALQGAILVELGLPDRAREPLERAMKLTASREPEVCARPDPKRCARHKQDPRPLNFPAYLDAHLGEAARLLAIGAFQRAERLCDEIEPNVDWSELARQRKGSLHAANARRAQLAVHRATARLGGAAGERAKLESARAEFERVFEFEGFEPQDGITASCGVLEIDLELAEFARAKEYLAAVDAWIAEDPANAGTLDDRAWLTTLRARLQRLSGGDTTQSARALRGALDAWLDAWRGVERAGGIGVLSFDRPRLALVELFRSGAADAAIDHALSMQQFGVLWRELREPRPTVAQVREALCADDTGCVVYVISSGESVALSFDRKSAQLHTLPAATYIDARTNALRAALLAGDAPSAAQREVLAQTPGELSDALFPAALRERLRAWKGVRIVGLDQLGVPLQALTVLDGRPLGVTHAVAFLPSLASAWKLHERRAGLARRPGIALLAAPQAGEAALAQFGSARAEIDRELLAPLLEAAGARQLEPWLESRATLGALSGAKAQADVVHILAHGVIDGSRELRTLVVLTPDERAPDGLLSIERARAMNAPDVVLLSVCWGAAGVARPGDFGATDLGGAFLIAGASSVVLCDLELRLGDAVRFGAVVHARLAAGDSLARAVQAANVEFCAKHPGRAPWTLPYVAGLGL